MTMDGLPTPQRYWSMLAIAVGIIMAVLDAAIANVGLPTITRLLHATPATSVWVINAYQLVNVATLLPLASLGERIGYRRVYVAGLAVFTMGSLACALSPSLPVLLISRVVQAFGAAGVMAVNGALVRLTYPLASLGRGIGLNALAVSVASALAPTIASGILSVASWEWLFAVNVPFGLFNLVLALRTLPSSQMTHRPFDIVAAALNVLLFVPLFVGIDVFTRSGSTIGLAEISVGSVSGCILFRRTFRSLHPMIPLDLMRIPIFSLSVATSICSFAAHMLAFLAMPFFLERVLHRDQIQTGLLMTPWPVTLGLAATVAGQLTDRFSAAILGSIGLITLMFGLVALAVLSSSASTFDVCWRMSLCGLGFGLFQVPNNRALLTSAPRTRSGAAGGMLAVARLFGMTVGATLASVIFRTAPRNAECIELFAAAAFALVAGIFSLSRFHATVPLS